MSKEDEILRKCVSCHDVHMCQQSRKSRGSCISGVSVLQKVTLKTITLFGCIVHFRHPPLLAEKTKSLKTNLLQRLPIYLRVTLRQLSLIDNIPPT